jgi:hypothetical protein
MNIVDLRQTTPRQLDSLLEEEARHWRDELHWDYRGALERPPAIASMSWRSKKG